MIIWLFVFRSNQQIFCVAIVGKSTKEGEVTKRHWATKHNSNPNTHHLTPNILAEIVNKALKNVREREVFAADLRNELKQYKYEEPGGETQEFTVIKKLFGDYMLLCSSTIHVFNFFKGLSGNVATLLATKISDFILSYWNKNVSG